MVSAQGECDILVEDTVVCYAQPFFVAANSNPDYLYFFDPPGELSVFPNAEIELTEPSWVFMEIYLKSDSSLVCKDSIFLDLHPRILVELEQQNKGCPNECKAQVKATASGGFPPYRYLWAADVAPNDSSLALGLCSDDEYALIIYDTVCAFDTTYTIEMFNLPEIEVTSEPSDSVYTVNPQVTFYFENKSIDSIPLTNFFWEFGDGTTSSEMSPTHVFLESDTVRFAYTTIDGCDSAEYVTIDLRELQLEVPNVFTPNGDGINDTFEVPDLDKYIGNEIVIFNRWGQKIFEQNNYAGDWNGGRHPDGTYFYILRCTGLFEEEVFRGAVTILGSGN